MPWAWVRSYTTDPVLEKLHDFDQKLQKTVNRVSHAYAQFLYYLTMLLIGTSVVVGVGLCYAVVVLVGGCAHVVAMFGGASQVVSFCS